MRSVSDWDVTDVSAEYDSNESTNIWTEHNRFQTIF